MPQFDTAFWFSQIFWLLISFGGLYLGVTFIVFPLFDKIFSKRAEQIDKPLEKAEQLTQEVQCLQQQLDQKKEAFLKQHQHLLASAHKEELVRFQSALEKKEKDLIRQLQHQVQTLEQNEKKVKEGLSDFVSKAVKGSS